MASRFGKAALGHETWQHNPEVTAALLEIFRQVASSENGVTTRRWLLSVANAGSQVARANAKLLQKKVETRLQKSEKSTRPASSKNPKVLQSILSEAECLKQQVGSTVALDASSLGRQLVQLLEAADLSSIFASCHQDIPVTPSTPQPFMMAALQEQSFRRVAEAAEQQRPRVQTLCRYLSIPKTLTLAPDAQQVQLRCKSSASQAALQALTPLRLSLKTASQELKAALAPKQAAGSGGRSLAARLQSRPSLKELETSLDRLEAGLRTARRALKGRSEKKPKRGKERKEAQQEPEASPPLPAQAAQIVPAQAAKTAHSPPKVSTSKATPRTVVINCANVGTVYSESRRQLYSGTLASDTGKLPAEGSSKKGFDWNGVRRAFQYYESHGLQPQGVCKNRTAVLSPVPPDLKSRVIVCPVVDDSRDADDLFTIRLAMRYGCQLVDNDNYRDWKREEGKWGTNDDIRDWLQGDGANLKVPYVFDRTGRFIPSVPPLRTENRD